MGRFTWRGNCTVSCSACTKMSFKTFHIPKQKHGQTSGSNKPQLHHLSLLQLRRDRQGNSNPMFGPWTPFILHHEQFGHAVCVSGTWVVRNLLAFKLTASGGWHAIQICAMDIAWRIIHLKKVFWFKWSDEIKAARGQVKTFSDRKLSKIPVVCAQAVKAYGTVHGCYARTKFIQSK